MPPILIYKSLDIDFPVIFTVSKFRKDKLDGIYFSITCFILFSAKSTTISI
jgi:hypothetical protein